MEIITHSREETVAAGREFAKTLPGGALIAFTGGLGAGKMVACEWSENCADLLEQEQPIHIHIDRVDETTRKITIG